MSARRLAALAAALLSLLGLVLASGGPAYADPKKLTLGTSATGPWAENLAAPLFSGTFVPGSATSTFYARNGSSQTARLTLELVGHPATNAFESALSFTAAAGGFPSQDPVPLVVDKKKCRTIVTGPTIAPGGTQRIDVTMRVDPSLPASAMNQRATFGFVVTLSQVTPKGKVDACGEQAPAIATIQVMGAQAASSSATLTSGAPARAGAQDARSATAVSLVAGTLLLTGGLLVAVRRRRDGHD